MGKKMNKKGLQTLAIIILIALVAIVIIWIFITGIDKAIMCALFPEYSRDHDMCNRPAGESDFETEDEAKSLLPPSAQVMKFAIDHSVLNKESGEYASLSLGGMDVMCSKPLMELGADKESAAETLARLMFECYTTATRNPDIQSIQNKGGKHTCYEVNTSKLQGKITIEDINKYLNLNEGAVDLRGGTWWNPFQGAGKWEYNINQEYGKVNNYITSKTGYVRICTGKNTGGTKAFISSEFASEKYSNRGDVCPPLSDVENQYQCRIQNFVLPQEKPAKPSEWIGGFGDPQYLLYTEQFEPHAEEYWHFQIEWKGIAAGVAIVGVFEFIPGVGSKVANAFKKGSQKEAAEIAETVIKKELVQAEKKAITKATARSSVLGFMRREGAFTNAVRFVKRFFVKEAEAETDEAAKLGAKGLKQLEIVGGSNPALKNALVKDAMREEAKLAVEGLEVVAETVSRSTLKTAKESTEDVFVKVIGTGTSGTRAAATDLERAFVRQTGGTLFEKSPGAVKAMARSVIEEESQLAGPVKEMVEARARALMNKAGKKDLAEFIPQAKEELITGAEDAMVNALKKRSDGTVVGDLDQALTAMQPSISTTAVDAMESNMIKEIGRSTTGKEIDDFAIKLVDEPTKAIGEAINKKVAGGMAETQAKQELSKDLADALKKGFGITEQAAVDATQETLDPNRLNAFAMAIVREANNFNDRTTKAIGTVAGAPKRSAIEKAAGNTARLGVIAMLAGTALDHIHDVKYTTHGANTLVFHQLASAAHEPESVYDLDPAVQNYMVTNAFDYENPNARFYAVSPCKAYVIVKTSRCECERINKDYRYRVGNKPVNGYPVPASLGDTRSAQERYEEAQLKAAGLPTSIMVSDTPEGRKAAEEYQRQVAEALRPPSMFNIDPTTVIEKDTVQQLLPEEKDKLKYYLYTGGLDPEKGYVTEVNYDYLENYIDFSQAVKECPADNWMTDIGKLTDHFEYIEGNPQLSERLHYAYDGAKAADEAGWDGSSNIAQYLYYANVVKVASEVPNKLQFDCVQVMMYPEEDSYCYMGFNEKVAAATATLTAIEIASDVAVGIASAMVAAQTAGASTFVAGKFIGAIHIGFEIARQYVQNFAMPGLTEPSKWPHGHHGDS